MQFRAKRVDCRHTQGNPAPMASATSKSQSTRGLHSGPYLLGPLHELLERPDLDLHLLPAAHRVRVEEGGVVRVGDGSARGAHLALHRHLRAGPAVGQRHPRLLINNHVHMPAVFFQCQHAKRKEM